MTLPATAHLDAEHSATSPVRERQDPDSHHAGALSSAIHDNFSPLSERDQAVLAFERTRWKFGAAKEQAVLEQFGLTAVRYYQILNALIDQPAALAADPLLVKRLRRLRAARRQERTTRHLSRENDSLTG